VGTVFWPRAAPLYRRLLTRTTFIAITGSCGKSTTRLLTQGAVGASRSPKVRREANLPVDNAHAIWTTPLSQRFAVFEVSVGKYAEKDMVKRSAVLIRPHVVVVTNIRDDHLAAFGSHETIAREKGDLVEALDENGVAVLNADDPLVMSMRSRCRGRVLTYGIEQDADVRADDIVSQWPDRLSLRVHYQGDSVRVDTLLCGAHWASAALAAIAAGIASGVPLADAARGLRSVKPFYARMDPTTRADGVTFVRDDVKAPLWTVPASLAFLGDAKAPRKIAVLGTISDYKGEARRVYANVARQALAVADHVIFVGQHAAQGLRAKRPGDKAELRGFQTLATAHSYLRELLAPGDLVLLKGSNEDRLDLLAHERFPTPPGEVRSLPLTPSEGRESSAFGIIGLGNDGDRFNGTRHNIGFECVDRLAKRHGVQYSSLQHAYVAQFSHAGLQIYLIKARAAMNSTGSALGRVLPELRLTPDRCLLVHDQLDFEVARVRGRMSGGAGGHRGVISILETFENFQFGRVKIGIGTPSAGTTVEEHVLQPFAADEHEAIDRAVDAAAEQALIQIREIALRARRLSAGRTRGVDEFPSETRNTSSPPFA
jgi:UDP-N-acetylmuramoyl-tripeptide--D-alanyl-D-alanine ligase